MRRVFGILRMRCLEVRFALLPAAQVLGAGAHLAIGAVDLVDRHDRVHIAAASSPDLAEVPEAEPAPIRGGFSCPLHGEKSSRKNSLRSGGARG